MDESKLTPWFVDGEKPVHPGVYNVSCLKYEQSGLWFAKWNGAWWYMASGDVSAAARMRYRTSNYDKWHDEGSWRGLAEKPE